MPATESSRATSRSAHVLVVEPDWMTATQLRRALDAMDVEVAMASRLEDVVHAISRRPPNLLIVGFDECHRALEVARAAALPVVFVTTDRCEAMLGEALRLDPRAIILKPFTASHVRVAVELALSNAAAPRADSARKTLAKIAELLADEPSLRRTSDPAILAPLSPRERDVVRSLLAHERVASISSRLGISENTVRNHLKSTYRKLGVHSQSELLDVALGRRPLPPLSTSTRERKKAGRA